MYGRLAWKRMTASESITAMTMPTRALVAMTPTSAVIARTRSVRRNAQ